MFSHQYLVEEYVDKQRSTHEIADDLGTYPNKVRRALIKHGIPVRNRSDAQTAALKNGTQSHPTKGAPLSPEHREKIGERTLNVWSTMTNEEKIRRSELSRTQWDKMGDDQREHLQDMALEAVRKTAVTAEHVPEQGGAEVRQFVESDVGYFRALPCPPVFIMLHVRESHA